MSEEISALIRRLSDNDGLVRQAARLSLEDIGRPATPYLCKLLSDRREHVRWEAVKALVEIADPSSAKALVKLLEDKVFDIRWLAAEALIKVGKPALAPALKAILLTKEPDWLWEGVGHIVRDLGQGELEPLLSSLVAAFDDIDYRMKVPIEAGKLLAKLRSLPEDIGV
jgi:HEAT repeat protein